MGSADFYKPGAFNVICDRTGFKIKSTNARDEWNNQTVRRESWEGRHPQDFLRSKADKTAVEGANPESDDYFLSTNEVTTESL